MGTRDFKHGLCPYEREILALWDAGHSRQRIERMTPYSRSKIEDALGYNEDGAHRRHCAAMRSGSSTLLAALQAAPGSTS